MIAWTPALRALVYPTRERPDPEALLRIVGGISSGIDANKLTVAGSYAWLRDGEDSRDIARARKGRARAPAALRPVIDRALEERARKSVPHGTLDVDVEAAAIALGIADAWSAMPYWLAKEGVAFALHALVRAQSLEPSHNQHGYGSGMVWIEESWDYGFQLDTDSAWQMLRAALAAVDATDYARARQVATKLRESSPLYVRCGIAFAFASERGWADADASEVLATQKRAFHNEPLLATVASHALAERLIRMDGMCLDDALRMTLLDAHGDDGAQLLLAALDKAPRAEVRKECASAVALVSSKAAAEGLARWLGDKSVAPIATKYMVANPELAREVLGSIVRAGSRENKLAGAAALVLERIDGTSDNQPTVEPAHAKPPARSRPRASESMAALTLAPLPYKTRIVWKKGELAENARATANWDKERKEGEWKKTHATDEKLVAWMGDRSLPLFWIGRIASSDVAMATWTKRSRGSWWGGSMEYGALCIVARHGMHAVPTLLEFAKSVSKVAPVVARIDGPEVAPLMAEWRARLKSVRPIADTWLDQHPEVAAIGLLPLALGSPGVARESAVAALAYLRERGHTKTLDGVARRYGADATAGLQRLFGGDATPVLPARKHKLPQFANADALPRPKLATGKAMSIEAAQELVTLLATTEGTTVHPELIEAKGTCTPDSLRDFAWALFERWLAANAPPKENWALFALGAIGDDEVVKRLAPLVRAWPQEKAIARASAGLDVLGAIGTDLALANIDSLSRGFRFASVRDKSRKMIETIARTRRMTPDELADRIVPDLGGARLDAPLKKDDKRIVAQQVARLERAMVTQRTWATDAFMTLVVGHPLMRQLARGLVWSARAGKKQRLFRLAEDGTLADVRDKSLALTKSEAIAVAHPLLLTRAEKTAWSAVFADYEIIQPFEQLARVTFDTRENFGRGIRLSTGGVRALLARGFEACGDSWMHELVQRDGTLVIVAVVEPGFSVALRDIEAQTIDSLTVREAETEKARSVQHLSPIAYSELRRTIEAAAS